MEWKKIASVKYGKIAFHSIPCHALVAILFANTEKSLKLHLF